MLSVNWVLICFQDNKMAHHFWKKLSLALFNCAKWSLPSPHYIRNVVLPCSSPLSLLYWALHMELFILLWRRFLNPPLDGLRPENHPTHSGLPGISAQPTWQADELLIHHLAIVSVLIISHSPGTDPPSIHVIGQINQKPIFLLFFFISSPFKPYIINAQWSLGKVGGCSVIGQFSTRDNFHVLPSPM